MNANQEAYFGKPQVPPTECVGLGHMVPLYPISFKDTWTSWYEQPPRDPRITEGLGGINLSAEITDKDAVAWVQRYDDAVQSLQKRCSEYLARIEFLETELSDAESKLAGRIAELEAELATLRAQPKTYPYFAGQGAIVITPEMLDAAMLTYGCDTRQEAEAIYRAMRAIEPMPMTPGLWSDTTYAALLAENAILRTQIAAADPPTPADLPDPPRRPDGTLAPTGALATNPFRSPGPPKRQIGA